MSVVNQKSWDDFIKSNPDVHVLQTTQWGRFKAEFGWKPKYLICGNSGAQLLFRRLPLGLSIGYIPKGPVGTNWYDLLVESEILSRDLKAIVLYIEPDYWEEEFDVSDLLNAGFSRSDNPIQPQRTLTISLRGSEDDWLSKMKQKTRYNIRLAIKKEVKVESSNDINSFISLMSLTGQRDKFAIHSRDYYQRAFEIFSGSGKCVLLIARYQGRPIASLMAFSHGNRAWYFYGASDDNERNRMPTFLLQWEAMRWAASQGCLEYDLWGVPDENENILEENFLKRSDGLWGVYRFKRGFGGELKRSAGVYKKVLNNHLFPVYQKLMRYRKGIIS